MERLFAATCKDCGRPFTLTEGEVKRYEGKGFPLPKRCKECRKKRREGRRGMNKPCEKYGHVIVSAISD